jgi:hypothetical protein
VRDVRDVLKDMSFLLGCGRGSVGMEITRVRNVCTMWCMLRLRRARGGRTCSVPNAERGLVRKRGGVWFWFGRCKGDDETGRRQV